MGRNTTKRIWHAAVGFLVVVLVLAGCAPSDRANPQSGQSQPASGSRSKRLTAAIQGDATVLSATLSPSGSAGSIPGVDAVEDLLHAGLGNFDPNGELWPQLAESIPTLENGGWVLLPDGQMETTWHLRERALWHDGTPLTSDDLLFTLHVAREKRVPQFASAAFDLVDGVTAPDSRTITVTWRSPYVDANTLFTHLPAHAMPLPRRLLQDATRRIQTGSLTCHTGTKPSWAPAPSSCRNWYRAATSPC